MELLQKIKAKLSKRLSWLLCFLFVATPVIIDFKNIFFSGPLAGGDALFFYKEGLMELITEPLSWSGREVNFGGVNSLLWLSPLTALYGLLGAMLNLGNDLAVRIVFYFPAIAFSL